jgi:excisionase family DNA binding protein
MAYLVADTESINVWRAARHLTARDLASKSGVNVATVSGLCSGRFTRVFVRTGERIAAALEVDLAEIFVPPLDGPDETYLTVEEVGRILRRHPRTVYRRIDDGELDAVRDGRNVLVPRASLEAYVAQRTIRSAS